MSTPHYVVTRFGDRYVPILQDPYPRTTRGVQVGWAALLLLLGSRSRGLTRVLLWLGAAGLGVSGSASSNWLTSLRARWPLHRDSDGRSERGPSYQNDFGRRATQLPADVVDEQVMESFPASDPPGRANGVHGG